MPSSPWAFWEAKGPQPCEEVNPNSACTEVWVRSSSSSPYEAYVGGQEIASTVSLPPVSCRSLPARRSLQQPISSSAIQESEPAVPWFDSPMLQKMYVALSLSGPSAASPRTGEREETSAGQTKAIMLHQRINPSVDPRQIAADDFGYSLSNSDAGTMSFAIPSTLVAAQYPDRLRLGWKESSQTAIRPLSASRLEEDKASGDETDDAWDRNPAHELSSLALMGISLRNALVSASATGRTADTAGDALGHASNDGQARPSMTYP